MNMSEAQDRQLCEQRESLVEQAAGVVETRNGLQEKLEEIRGQLAHYRERHEEASEKVRDKFLSELCGPDKDTHFYVGTILAYPNTWVVIGVFYPKIKPRKAKLDKGLTLFD